MCFRASISLDFIFGFSKVKGMSSLMVVVDRFTKYFVFIQTPATCPAEQAATLIIHYVVKHFGVLQDMVRDHGTWFLSWFWTVLFSLMGTELKFTMANHPQNNGRINSLLEEYLSHYISASQKDWLDLLYTTQFVYNLHQSSSTSQSPTS